MMVRFHPGVLMYESDVRQKLAEIMMEEINAEWLYHIRLAEERHNGKVVDVEETPHGICLVVKHYGDLECSSYEKLSRILTKRF